MPIGKCPSCEKMVTHLSIESVDASSGIGGPAWNAVNYLCPWCNTILGAEIDPIALKSDTVNEIVKRVRKER